MDITAWTNTFMQALDNTFGQRVWFVGLQGSYARGEATEASDIDMVVILDELSAADVTRYNAMLDTLPHREQLCGFLAGKQEVESWEPSDLFSLYYDTKPLKGTLVELASKIDDAAVRRAVQIGLCNLYHGCVHNVLYEKNVDILKGLYKSAAFTVRAIHFMQTGQYIHRMQELREAVGAAEQTILDVCLTLKNGGEVVLGPMFETLFTWAQGWINQMGEC